MSNVMEISTGQYRRINEGHLNSALRSECTNKEVLFKIVRERQMMRVTQGI